MVNTVAIILSENTTVDQFTCFYAPKIQTAMGHPHTHFIFSDRHPFVARYLSQQRFRSCTIYHAGNTPKHTIGGYQLQGGFTSYVEIDEALREAADEII